MADKTKRQYPEISFVDTDPERLINALIKGYEAITDTKLYPADPRRLFILWIADIIIQERVIIDNSAKQNVPRYAEGEYLDSLAEIFKDAERLRPQPAITTMRLHISAVQLSTHVIPSGTRITVDGDITFATTQTVNIPPGELYGDAEAECITTVYDPKAGEYISIGAKGNGYAPGRIKNIVDLYPFYARVENITESGGGADTETDEAFYERMRENTEAFSTAGSVGAYSYWVKTASQIITDVKPTSPEPGVVDIRVLLENGEYPNEEMIQLIFKTLDGKIPLTDTVRIAGPETHLFDINLTYYIPQQRAESTAAIKEEAEKAVKAYKQWQTEKMGRDINPSRLISFLMSAGIKRVDVIQPVFEIVEEIEVAALANFNVVYGGIENE